MGEVSIGVIYNTLLDTNEGASRDVTIFWTRQQLLRISVKPLKDRWFHLTFYGSCDYLFMLGLQIISVSKSDPRKEKPPLFLFTNIGLLGCHLKSEKFTPMFWNHKYLIFILPADYIISQSYEIHDILQANVHHSQCPILISNAEDIRLRNKVYFWFILA